MAQRLTAIRNGLRLRRRNEPTNIQEAEGEFYIFKLTGGRQPSASRRQQAGHLREKQ
jgi:hypothetical protein